jgi:quercetin dioxygenase-like cupin family protein
LKEFLAMGRRAIFLSVACTAFGFAAGIFAASAPRMIVTPADSIVFKPMDPSRPAAAQIAVLRGDPASGPSAMLMKFGKGAGPMHIHSSDYDLIVLEGETKHWAADEPEASAKVLGPGSYWFQPANQPHGDNCLSDECVMYVQWAGKSDSRAVQNAGTN